MVFLFEISLFHLKLTLFLDKGQVFGWGNSEYNQLCKADDEKQLKVSRYLNLESKIGKAISIAAAGSMCSVINGIYLLLNKLL